MLVVDSQKTIDLLTAKQFESEQERYAKWLDEHTRLAQYNDDPTTSPLAAARRIGKPMLHTDLERKLAKLNRKLCFMGGDLNSHHKWLCIDVPDPRRAIISPNDPFAFVTKLFLYPTGAIPERSIFRQKDEWVVDPTYIPKPGDVNRADWEWVPRKGEENKFRVDGWRFPDSSPYGKWKRKDDNVGRAGWKKVSHAWGEYKRGWRTVLINLVKLNLLSVHQVEDHFLSDDTPEWARHTGKKDIYRPW